MDTPHFRADTDTTKQENARLALVNPTFGRAAILRQKGKGRNGEAQDGYGVEKEAESACEGRSDARKSGG